MTERTQYDIVVVGAGPAGLAAAVEAARGGARVCVVDQNPHLGGQIWRHRDPSVLPGHARRWLRRFARSGCDWIPNAGVASVADDGGLLVNNMDGARRLRAGALILATGARERFIPFPGWTLPNVLGLGGIQALVKQGLDVRGRRVVLAGSGPLMLPVAATLARRGARLLIVAEQASAGALARIAAGMWRTPSRIAQAVGYRVAFRTAAYKTGTWVVRAEGSDAVRSVTLTDGTRSWTLECDLLGTGDGLVPNVELATLAGCVTQDGAIIVDAMQRTSVPWIFAAGECAGVAGQDVAVLEGRIAGLAACGRDGEARALRGARDRARSRARRMLEAFALCPGVRARVTPETIICRCEDVPAGALDPDWTAREAKLVTRLGMGPCQGRVCGPATCELMGWDAQVVRPPVQPTRVGPLVDLLRERRP